MKKRLLAMATVCSICVLLAGCETEKNRLDQEVRRLCAKDGGVKIYETVKLTPKLLDSFGRIWIPSIKDAKESDEYYYVSQMVYLRKGDPDMWRRSAKIIRRSDGKVLGESVYYARRGGDIPGPWHRSSFGCDDIRKNPDFEKAIFLKESEK